MAVERVVLVIDVSPSMSMEDYPPTRMEAAKKAAKEFIDKKFGIDPYDEVAVVAFAGVAREKCPLLQVGKGRSRIAYAIDLLDAVGTGTAMERGLLEAAKSLGITKFDWNELKWEVESQKLPYLNRIVLLSDGQNNSTNGNPVALATKLKGNGVVIDTIGIGDSKRGRRDDGLGLDEDTLRKIASPGRYRYIRASRELIEHFSWLAEKVRQDEQRPGMGTQLRSEQDMAELIAKLKSKCKWIYKIGPDSPYIGGYCPNERDDETRFKVGDLVVFCPECQLLHHADCWLMNSSRCYGGQVPCSGHRLLPE